MGHHIDSLPSPQRVITLSAETRRTIRLATRDSAPSDSANPVLCHLARQHLYLGLGRTTLSLLRDEVEDHVMECWISRDDGVMAFWVILLELINAGIRDSEQVFGEGEEEGN